MTVCDVERYPVHPNVLVPAVDELRARVQSFQTENISKL